MEAKGNEVFRKVQPTRMEDSVFYMLVPHQAKEAAEMKKGDVVTLKIKKWSAFTGRFVKPGVKGRVLGLKEDRALVKFKGFDWPLDVRQAILMNA